MYTLRQLFSSGSPMRIVEWVKRMLKFTNSIINSFLLIRRDEVKCNSPKDDAAAMLNSFQNTCRLKIFQRMLETDIDVRRFLEYDECCLLADNYLIAMVAVYFIRSNLQQTYYDAAHFFSALYLAHEMEEDLEELKDMIVPWFPAPHLEKRLALNEMKFFLWEFMKLNCLVKRTECEWVMNETQDWSVWKRNRKLEHHYDSMNCHIFKNCCACILRKSFRCPWRAWRDPKDDDVLLKTSDWEIDDSDDDVFSL